jgi:hypothetical protein
MVEALLQRHDELNASSWTERIRGNSFGFSALTIPDLLTLAEFEKSVTRAASMVEPDAIEM